MKNFILFFTLILLLACCESKQDFPPVIALQDLKQTTFLTALEAPIELQKNNIYAASLLVAWQEMKEIIDVPIQDIESPELKLVHTSDGYANGLEKEEWNIDVKVDEAIQIEVLFSKSLPFSFPLDISEEAIDFLGTSVQAFTTSSPESISSILYYHNDSDFAIKLRTEDEEHEIILIKTDFATTTTLKEEIEKVKEKVQNFKDNYNTKIDWKYRYQEEDKFLIPIISFNIEYDYPNIVGTNFFTESTFHEIVECKQRSAFVLNEKGAIIEMEAELADTTSTEAMMEEEIPQPKNIVFDKPFLLLLQKKNSKYPYFAVFISNVELLKLEVNN